MRTAYDARTSRTNVTFNRRFLVAALSLVGWVFGAFAWWVISSGELRAGVDLQAYIRAGQDLLAGRPVYIGEVGGRLVFSYAPPWAVACAALAWIPGPILQLGVMVLDLVSLRYLVGSWQRIGLTSFFPITVFVIVAGNLELMIAAAIVLAWRAGRPEPLVAFALAKIAPALALPPRHWRPAVVALAVAVLITLPWLWLWREWVEYLLRQPALIAISIPIPWFYRLPFALALLLVRRPWAAALAAVVAIPTLYNSTLLILLAPIRLYLDERAGRAPSTEPAKGVRAPPLLSAAVTASARPSVLQRTRDRFMEFVHRVGRHVPASLGGHLHRLPTRLTFGITGPFNGQRQRVAAVAAMFRAVPFATVIETGTYRALTTRHLRRTTTAPIATIEVNPRYFEYSKRRLRGLEQVEQFLGHSPAVLDRLRHDDEWQAEPCFFYLDAHWLDDLPLLDELRVIRQGWHDFAALIDDFRVEGDDGYFYDDYGAGKTLALPLLTGVAELADLLVFWPTAESRRESGARRGWVVLASPGTVADALASVAELRAGGTLGAPLQMGDLRGQRAPE